MERNVFLNEKKVFVGLNENICKGLRDLLEVIPAEHCIAGFVKGCLDRWEVRLKNKPVSQAALIAEIGEKPGAGIVMARIICSDETVAFLFGKDAEALFEETGLGEFLMDIRESNAL